MKKPIIKRKSHRFKTISDPDGNAISLERPFNHASIERIDGRTPLHKYFRFRFRIMGDLHRGKFINWMTETFGPSMGYGEAKAHLELGVDLSDVKWVLHTDNATYYTMTHIYFNHECEPLVFLKFG